MSGDTIRSDLKRLRDRRNLSQEDAGRLVGVGRTTWSDWERGSEYPSRLARRALSYAFRAEIEAMTPRPVWYIQPRL